MDDAGEERLVIVQEVERDWLRRQNQSEVIEAVRRGVAEAHQLQVSLVVLIKPATLPRTSSGKVRRRACREALLAGDLAIVAQCNAPVPKRISQAARNEPREADDLIGWLREYAETRINSRLIDERRCIPPYVVLDFGNRGLLGMQVPRRWGGLELSHADTLRVLEQLGAIDLTLALFVGLNNVLGIRPILDYGTEALQQELLPALASGRDLAAFALTERAAGSNPRAIQTTATRVANAWAIRGTKIWSGAASWASIINVFAMDRDATGALQGMSAFTLRPDAAGLRHGPEAMTMGMRGIVQNAVQLDDVQVGPEQLLGLRGGGMQVAQEAMNYGRLAIAAAALGCMKRCAQLMVRYASRRLIAGGLLLHNPTTCRRLSEVTAAVTAVELLVQRLGRLLDEGVSIPPELFAVCKTSAPELLWRTADRLVQLLGGRGYMETNIAPQILRDARVLRIFEGPTETLNGFLASRLTVNISVTVSWLSRHFEAPAAARRLEEAFQAAKPHGASSELLGQLATWGMLLASVETAASKSESASHAAAWCSARFDRTLRAILEGKKPPLMDSSALMSEIEAYGDSIGDVEQQLPGEDADVDPLLRRDRYDIPATSEGDAPEFLTASIAGAHGRDAAAASSAASRIESWLREWLAARLGMSIGEIPVDRSFADLGLDSLMAVELAGDLSEWFGKPLEETALWRLPSISAVASWVVADGANGDTDSHASASSSSVTADRDTSADDLRREIEALEVELGETP